MLILVVLVLAVAAVVMSLVEVLAVEQDVLINVVEHVVVQTV